MKELGFADLGFPEDPDYTGYVGPSEEYDFMGASQFRLLCTLGLRATHKLLDFGCGSLRAGRFFLTYLNEGCYCGVEPNKWLIEDAIKYQIGHDIIRIKKPFFSYNNKFCLDEFDSSFDFILAQSIFTHTGINLLNTGLKNFSKYLNTDGIILATFIEGESDTEGDVWEYPKAVPFRPSTIMQIAQDADLVATKIPWYRPRQTWYAFAKNEDRLPTPSMFPYLKGTVLFDPEHRSSW